MEDGVDIVVGPQPRYFKLAVSAVSHVPPLEIFVSEVFLFVNFSINRDVGVTVRSVHFMQRAHSVEYLVLNSTNDLLSLDFIQRLQCIKIFFSLAHIVPPTQSSHLTKLYSREIREEE